MILSHIYKLLSYEESIHLRYYVDQFFLIPIHDLYHRKSLITLMAYYCNSADQTQLMYKLILDQSLFLRDSDFGLLQITNE